MESLLTAAVAFLTLNGCSAFVVLQPYANSLVQSKSSAHDSGRRLNCPCASKPCVSLDRRSRSKTSILFGILEEGTSESLETEDVSICIIGGGVSGLTAAFTAAESLREDVRDEAKIVLLESSPSLGGRVQSDVTEDGFILDKGFAVFIEGYPKSKEILDYDALKLGRFLPGALVKLKDENRLAKVADPLRVPGDTLDALLSPIGSIFDKLKLIPLLVNIFSKSIEELFEEEETDVSTCLRERYGFSEDFIDQFLKPFFEGIFFCPLEEQSSRMFHFVMKMFSEGVVALPAEGMGAVVAQLAARAEAVGADLRTGMKVFSICHNNDGTLTVRSVGNGAKDGSRKDIRAISVILATDGQAAQNLMSTLDGFGLFEVDKQPKREVGCIYYSLKTAPVMDPVLILSGMGKDRGTASFPINNVCFPSVVNRGYAPAGMELCSVTILKDTVDYYRGNDQELDAAVRKELALWFPEIADDIRVQWELKGMYIIPNAQPTQLSTWGATVHGGRECNSFRGKLLPKGLFICGDHIATATLNGAIESGINAGKAAADLL